MKNAILETLSPVHIGSGQEYQEGYEYLHFRQEKKVAVLNPEKVLGIIGEDLVHQWVEAIDNQQSILELLKMRKQHLCAADLASRVIPAEKTADKPIRAHLYNGTGGPLVPGSSVKGAIRTALFAEWILADESIGVEQHEYGEARHGGRFVWKDKFLNQRLFGSNPNQDILRLLQAGDFEFEDTRIEETIVVNLMNKHWGLKDSLTQFVEVIPPGRKATGRLTVNEDLKKLIAKGINPDLKIPNIGKLDLKNLLVTVNQHTKLLLEKEIEFWEEEENPGAIEDYLDHCNEILEVIKGCEAAGNCFVFRLGWGIGFRSITGGWHDIMNDNWYRDLKRSLRRHHPETLIFPKTTRMIATGIPLGFVKLSFK